MTVDLNVVQNSNDVKRGVFDIYSIVAPTNHPTGLTDSILNTTRGNSCLHFPYVV